MIITPILIILLVVSMILNLACLLLVRLQQKNIKRSLDLAEDWKVVCKRWEEVVKGYRAMISREQ